LATQMLDEFLKLMANLYFLFAQSIKPSIDYNHGFGQLPGLFDVAFKLSQLLPHSFEL